MTSRMKLSLEQSAARESLLKLVEISDKDRTPEQRAEMVTLTERLTSIEPEIRASLILEATEEAQAVGAFSDTATAEQKEIRSLLGKITLADYLSPASAGNGISGAALEANAALKIDPIGKAGGVILPLQVLLGTEERSLDHKQQVEQRAFSTTASNSGPELQRPVLQRLFGPGIADQLGIRLDTVSIGKTEYNVLTGTTSPDQVKEGTAAAAATAATFDSATLKPKKLVGVVEYTHEMGSSVPDIDMVLRMDLSDAIRSKMQSELINGMSPTNQNPHYVEGFLSAVSEPSDAGAVATYPEYASAHAVFDGKAALTERDISSVVGVDVLKHAAKVFQPGSGESGSEAMERRSQSCVSSSYIPAASGMQAKNNLFHLAGSNGGGILRGDSVAAVWASSAELIKDPYSKATQGVIISYVLLWDAAVALRPTSYVRSAFQIA